MDVSGHLHWTGHRRVGLRAGLDAVAKRKKSHQCPCWELNPGRPARSLVSVLTELPPVREILNCVQLQMYFRRAIHARL
jgi:hypothetical protein